MEVDSAAGSAGATQPSQDDNTPWFVVLFWQA